MKLSIGICAYNEAENIAPLLRSLTQQEVNGFELDAIIVNSDGSTDSTVQEAQSIRRSSIVVWERRERKGKSFRQHEIFTACTSDLLLMLDADVRPKDNKFLTAIVEPFLSNESKTIGLVSCPLVPLRARTHVEKILNFSVDLKEVLLRSLNGGDNLYACHGPVRLFSKKLLTAYQDVSMVSEDAYSYLLCKEQGLRFCYVTSTFVYFRSPRTLREHLRQSIRFQKGQEGLIKRFGTEVVAKAHAISGTAVLRTLIAKGLKHPLLFVQYLCVYAISICARVLKPAPQNGIWEMVSTSKKL